MRPEPLSSARPTGLRLGGFLALTLGSLAAGVGALVPWARVGFVADVRRVADVSVHGVDVWEGLVVLGSAVVALFLLIGARASRSASAGRSLACAIMAAGAIAVTVTAMDLMDATQRFGSAGVRADVARAVADRLGQPVAVVRPLLERAMARGMRVDIAVGLPVSLLGGAGLIVAGILTLRWASSDSGSRAASEVGAIHVVAAREPSADPASGTADAR